MIISKKNIIIILFCIISTDTYSNVKIKKNEIKSNILFVFDASYSMNSRWQSGRKIDVAKRLLFNILDSLKSFENLKVGLRVYGHQKRFPPQDCDDTKLEIDFSHPSNAINKIKAKLKMINARGTTPIAYALEEGAKDFPINNERNIVILITDGKEECQMDPCAVSKLYQREGIILKPFVIGIGLEKKWQESFDCVGTFFNANNEQDFKNILELVISHVVDNTTVQVNLLDSNNYITETNVNLTFYDSYTGIPKYNYIHTMNGKGNPDTMVIDPVLSYNVLAHTIPSVKTNTLKIIPGKHNIIAIKTPQGSLEVNINSQERIPFLIRQINKDIIINVQYTNTVKKYLIGEYELEILTLPRISQKIRINQSKKTKIFIPKTGIANIILPSKGYGGIYLNKNNDLIEIYSFNGKESKHQVNLLPGDYKIIYRSMNSEQYLLTKERFLSISSGKSTTIKIN